MFHWASLFVMMICFIIVFICFMFSASGGVRSAEAATRAEIKYGVIGLACMIIFIFT